MPEAQLSGRKRHGALIALSFLPALIVPVMIWYYSVDVPVYDDWGIITPLFSKFHQGSLSLYDLFSQANESRPVFPRILFIALGELTKGDYRAYLMLFWLVAVGTSVLLYKLCALTVSPDDRVCALLMFLVNLFMFSLRPTETWLWATTSVMLLLPIGCMVLAFYVLQLKLCPWRQNLATATLCFIATFSFVFGLSSWFLIGPCLIAKNWKRVRSPLLYLGLWLLPCVLSFYLYFRDYTTPPYHPDLHLALHQPRDAYRYFFTFLGASVSMGLSTQYVKYLGCALFLLFAFISLWALRFYKEARFSERYLVWLALGVYPIFAAAVTTAGRLGFGIDTALSSRYSTHTAFLPIALLFLTPMALRDAKPELKFKPLGVAALVVALSFCAVLSSVAAWPSYAAWRSRQTVRKCALTFLRLNTRNTPNLFWMPNAELLGLAEELDGRGFWRSPMAKTFAEYAQPDVSGSGSFDGFVHASGDDYDVAGVALLPASGARPADAVVFTAEHDGVQDVVGVAEVDGDRRKGAWSARLNLPLHSTLIRAWSFDQATGKCYGMSGRFTVE